MSMRNFTTFLKNGLKSVSMTSKMLFRELSPFEQEAVSVIDNRDFSSVSPTQNLFLTCEHASKEYELY